MQSCGTVRTLVVADHHMRRPQTTRVTGTLAHAIFDVGWVGATSTTPHCTRAKLTTLTFQFKRSIPPSLLGTKSLDFERSGSAVRYLRFSPHLQRWLSQGLGSSSANRIG